MDRIMLPTILNCPRPQHSHGAVPAAHCRRSNRKHLDDMLCGDWRRITHVLPEPFTQLGAPAARACALPGDAMPVWELRFLCRLLPRNPQRILELSSVLAGSVSRAQCQDVSEFVAS